MTPIAWAITAAAVGLVAAVWLSLRLAARVVLTVSESALGLASPWPLKVVVDNAIGGRPLPASLGLLHGLGPAGLAATVASAGVLLVVLLAAVGYAATVLATVVSEHIGVRLRAGVVHRLVRAPVGLVDERRSGDLVTRITTDVARVQDSLLAKIEVLLLEILAVAGMAVLMVLLSPLLALVVLAVAPALAVLGILRRRAVSGTQRRARARSGDLAARAGELLANIRVVQAFGQQHAETRRFDQVSRDAGASVDATAVSARLSPGADLLLALDLAVVLVLGTSQVAAHRLSLGALLVFLAYLTALQGPVRSLSALAATLGRGVASAERIGEILDQASVPDLGEHRAPAAGAPAIAADRVDFAYGMGATVLRDVSCAVGAGETACIVGPSGAGKSTLLSLLVRLHDPDRGSLLLGGRDLRELSLRSLHEHVALVPQDAWLLAGTIEENIAYGRPSATTEEIRRAGQLALVDEFADRLPARWATEVGEGGVKLSGGQRRRIALARALLQDTPVLLLDEPTAGLDPSSEAVVTAAIGQVAEGRTVLIVTHELALASLAHQVIVLEAGSVAEAGDPAHLRLTGGAFARLEALRQGREGLEAFRLDPALELTGRR